MKTHLIITTFLIHFVLNTNGQFWENVPVKYNDTISVQILEMNNLNYKNIVDYSGIQYDSVVYLSSNFEMNVNFSRSIFKEKFESESCNFKDEVHFSDTKFNKLDFTIVNFYDYANFSFSNISSFARFRECVFKGKADFGITTFDSIVMFSGVKFESNVYFGASNFNNKAYFDRCYFDNASHVDFVNCKLPDTLNFTNIKISNGDIDFTKSYIEGTCYINLLGSDIERINLRYGRFKLLLNKIQYTRGPKTQTEQFYGIYEKLLKRTSDLGYHESYKILFREYKEFHYSNTNQNFLKFIDKNWWDYGLTKSLIFKNTLILFLFFSLINIVLFTPLVTKIYTFEKLELQQKLYIKESNWVLIGIKTIPFALLYTTFVFFGISINKKNI